MDPTLFNLPPAVPVVKPPRRHAPGYQQLRAQRQAQGLHPLNGLPLYVDPEGQARTCGGCAHRYAHECVKRYWKCDLYRETGGPATDIRVSWPGCSKWEPEAEG